MFIEINDLDFPENRFTKDGSPIVGNQEFLYISLYRSVLSRHFSSVKHLNTPKIDQNISEYTRFHLLPLLVDSGLKGEEAISLLEINEEKICRALTHYSRDNMWYTSNIHMGALAAVSILKLDSLNSLAFQLIQDLDITSFTSTKWKYKGSINRIAAFYHYIPFIDANNIEISKRTKEILFADLHRLQNSLGSFCSPNGFSCMELDSVVAAAYLKKFDYNTDDLLKKKLFNHLSNFDCGWPLYGFSSGRINDIWEILSSSAFIQDKLWNLKKILIDTRNLQFDNGHKELVSKANDKTLMSNYFGLVTYLQLIQALGISEKNNLKVFHSYGLSYVVQ